MKLLRLSTKKPVDKMIYIRTTEIQIHKDFQSLFPINPTVRDAIASSIRKNGFDENHPLILWNEEQVVLDGHTRLAASKLVGLKRIPVVFTSFPDLDAALEYARRLQFHRRNLTDQNLFAYVLRLKVDDLPGTGRKQERLARICNISVTRALRIIKVKNDGSKKQHSAILNGAATIHATYDQIKPSRVRTNSDSYRSSTRKETAVSMPESAILSTIEHLVGLSDKPLDPKKIATSLAHQLPRGATRRKALNLIKVET